MGQVFNRFKIEMDSFLCVQTQFTQIKYCNKQFECEFDLYCKISFKTIIAIPIHFFEPV